MYFILTSMAMDIIRTIDSEDEINLQNESDSDADMKVLDGWP